MDDWIDQLKGKRRVFVCVGPGGVGKTSIAGATALAFARRGLRVLCLTIDPAKRLAEALGLADPKAASAELSSEWFRRAGIETDGFLHVMMLDVESTFRELILGGKMEEQALENLVSSRSFQFLMKNVMGMQSYMAMERVLAVDESDRYDVIVLDTPPSQRALDFFDAPNRMLDLLASPLTRVLAQASSGAGRASWVERGAKVALRGLGRITGTGLLEELGAVLGTLSGLLSGFEARAKRAKARFASPEYGCLFVTTPGDLELLFAFEMVAQLRARGLGFDAMILNRFVRPLPADPEFDRYLQRFGEGGGEQADSRRARFDAIWQGRRREAEAHERAYLRVLGELPNGALCATVPEFPGEIQTARDLLNLSGAL